MNSKNTAIILVLLASILSAAAQILFKFASAKLEFSFIALITNVELILGFLIFIMVAVLFIIALRNGELTVLYPLLAAAFIWVAIASPFFFPSDSINLLKALGYTA
jgi:multidrug transporter EmrE-like cation transporter